MLQQFFGFREQPFGVSPDPRYLYLGPSHREALASLHYGIEANRGFLSLVARPGMGKTTLLFHLLEKFGNTARTAFLFQTQCNSREFMRFLLAEVGVESDHEDFVRMHDQFNRCLVEEARAGRRFIVVIDEAQNLDPSVLETVRLLSDFETPRAKLLQIILAGQPELADKLARPSLSQLRQRITSISGLNPFNEQETGEFIEHRLRVAGYEGPNLFSPEAQTLIAQKSEGIPRNINNYCFQALSMACATKQKTVDAAIVEEVAKDLDIHRLTSGEEISSAGDEHGWPDSSLGRARRFYEAAGERQRFSTPPSPSSPTTGGREFLNPADAIAHMQEVVKLLRSWRDGSTPPPNQRPM